MPVPASWRTRGGDAQADPVIDHVAAVGVWAAVAVGVRRRVPRVRGGRPGRHHPLPSGLRRRRQARRGGDHHRGFPDGRGSASSAIGTSPTRTARTCGRGRRSSRSPGTVVQCRTSCCGRTGSGFGWPRSVFYWNVIAPEWNDRIERAEISVTLPGAVPRAQCSVGYGISAPCRDLTISGDTVRLSASGDTVRLSAQNPAPRTPVTVRAGVDVATPPRAELPWTYKWERALGQSVSGALWVAA